MASGNKKQIRDIYKRIDGLATSLKRGAAKDSPITPEHEAAIAVLAAYEPRSLVIRSKLTHMQGH